MPIQTCLPPPNEIIDAEIAGILLTALFAGHHTSSVLGAWAGLELMQHPETLPSLRQETERVYVNGDAVSVAALRQQNRLERAIREAERLHPPLIILVRKVLRDLVYKGHVLTAGTMAMVSPAAAHRLPSVFPDPDHYDPDRFLQPDGSDRVEPHTMISFGGGKHVCIGMHFAYMQLKVIWSVLLSCFDFDLASPPPRITGNGLPVRYRRAGFPIVAVTRGWRCDREPC